MRYLLAPNIVALIWIIGILSELEESLSRLGFGASTSLIIESLLQTCKPMSLSYLPRVNNPSLDVWKLELAVLSLLTYTGILRSVFNIHFYRADIVHRCSKILVFDWLFSDWNDLLTIFRHVNFELGLWLFESTIHSNVACGSNTIIFAPRRVVFHSLSGSELFILLHHSLSAWLAVKWYFGLVFLLRDLAVWGRDFVLTGVILRIMG